MGVKIGKFTGLKKRSPETEAGRAKENICGDQRIRL